MFCWFSACTASVRVKRSDILAVALLVLENENSMRWCFLWFQVSEHKYIDVPQSHLSASPKAASQTLDFRIRVFAKVNASKTCVSGGDDVFDGEELPVRIAAKPQDDRANNELIRYISKVRTLFAWCTICGHGILFSIRLRAVLLCLTRHANLRWRVPKLFVHFIHVVSHLHFNKLMPWSWALECSELYMRAWN